MSGKFEQLDEQAKKQHLLDVATRALPLWGLPADAALTLLNISENATYRVDHTTFAEPLILRVHRTGYHTRDGIRTELAWTKALQAEANVETPQAIPGKSGELIETVATPALDEDRFVVLFEFIPGAEPSEDDLIEPFHRLGAIAARMHEHARGWQRPPYFERLLWDVETTIGPQGNWGDWRAAPGLDEQSTATLQRMADLIKQRLDAFGKGPERFGLAHADLRLANLLEHEGKTRVIDFDDTGVTWFMYDFATAVSFMEDREDMPELIDSWVAGYRTVSPLADDDVNELPTFLMLRRLAILAWIGSHGETDLARELGVPFAGASVPLAEKYLANFS
ncbi:MAG: phosphotransferase enzyme family protein [Gammaproteobacteria bacterium]